MTKGLTVAEANATALLLEDQNAKARRAYELRRKGVSWWDVAEELQVSEGVAKGLLSEAITEAAELVSEHTKRQLLAMEVARLDELMLAQWDYATEAHDRVDKDGNRYTAPPSLEAGKFIADLVMKRAKLTGLDQMTDQVQSHQTVVVAGTSAEYVAALQLIVGGRTVEGEVTDGAA